MVGNVKILTNAFPECVMKKPNRALEEEKVTLAQAMSIATTDWRVDPRQNGHIPHNA
jgi:hypothetical protein